MTLRVPSGARAADIDAFYARELVGWRRVEDADSVVYRRDGALLVVGGKQPPGEPPQIVLELVTGALDVPGPADGTTPLPPASLTPIAPSATTPVPQAPAVPTPAAPPSAERRPVPARLPRCPVRDRVPSGWIVAIGVDGGVLTLPRSGSGGCVLAQLGRGVSPDSIDLSPDRRRVVVGARSGDEPAIVEMTLDEPDRLREIARPASAPSFAPDGSLAFTELAHGLDMTFRKAIVVRDPAGREQARIAFPEWSIASGPPAEDVTSWSPDGRHIVLVEQQAIGLEADAARTSDGTPLTPSSTKDAGARLLALAFLDNDTVIAMSGCCVTGMALVAVDTATGNTRRLLALDAPVEVTDVDHATGEILLVTANHQTLSVWNGQTLRRLRTSIAAAAL